MEQMHNLYILHIADRAGNIYDFPIGLDDPIPKNLLKYINGEVAESTPEILFLYSTFIKQTTIAFAELAPEYYPVATAKLLCWINTQYNNINHIPFFKEKKTKRNIVLFNNYFSALSERDLAAESTQYTITRKLRNIYPEICEAYLGWDYLYEIKEICPAEYAETDDEN